MFLTLIYYQLDSNSSTCWTYIPAQGTVNVRFLVQRKYDYSHSTPTIQAYFKWVGL